MQLRLAALLSLMVSDSCRVGNGFHECFKRFPSSTAAPEGSQPSPPYARPNGPSKGLRLKKLPGLESLGNEAGEQVPKTLLLLDLKS